MKKRNGIALVSVLVVGAAVAAIGSGVASGSDAPSVTLPTVAKVSEQVAAVTAPGKNVTLALRNRLVEVAGSVRDDRGTPIGEDVAGLASSRVIASDGQVGTLSFLPAKNDDGYCYELELPATVGAYSNGRAGGCAPQLPASGVFYAATNDSTLDGYVVQGLAVDRISAVSVETKDGSVEPATLHNGVFLWQSKDKAGDSPARLIAYDVSGKAVHSEDLSYITAPVKAPAAA